MPDSVPTPPSSLQFSIIIAVYNDWGPLEGCLQSLDQQTNSPAFEVIVIDDGSKQRAPESIRNRETPYPFILIEQPHSGIASARNRGIQSANGSVLVFTDADCRLQPECLARLGVVIANSAENDYFQLHLIGDRTTLVGQAEELRLMAIQKKMVQIDGRIRYLNTAGFAVRRGRLDVRKGLFNPVALRSEDTFLLVDLIQCGKLPLFVADAVVQHSISLRFLSCMGKDIRSAWQEARTFALIDATGVQVRMSHQERIGMLSSTWKTSRRDSIGRTAWFVLVVRQSIQRIVTLSYRFLRWPREKPNAGAA
jgi:glycosyltransferase involved in cell wall biosynthesis